MWDLVKGFVRDEAGATMVEYGLMVALIAIVCVLAVTSLGDGVFDSFDAAASGVQSTAAAPQAPTIGAD